MFRAKLKAALLHGMITLAVALVLSLLVFGLWYPHVYSEILPGTKLFILILTVEIILGPCMSFIVYAPHKSTKELIFDYSCIGAVQFLALGYGLYSVALSRPAYVVFVKDRVEVVAAADIDTNDLPISGSKFSRVSWLGPDVICVRDVVSSQEKESLLFHYYPQGRDVQHLPKFYRDCYADEVYNKANDMKLLREITQKKSDTTTFDLIGTRSDVRWLPLHGKQGVWIVFFKKGNADPIEFLKFDPY